MSAAGVISVSMRNDGPINRTPGIDEAVGRLAVQAFGAQNKHAGH
jgi:hypothetical protein